MIETNNYCVEVRRVYWDDASFVIEFTDLFTGEILEYKKENCLDNCLIDIYEFTRECCDKYVKNNFDTVFVKIDNLQFE